MMAALPMLNEPPIPHFCCLFVISRIALDAGFFPHQVNTAPGTLVGAAQTNVVSCCGSDVADLEPVIGDASHEASTFPLGTDVIAGGAGGRASAVDAVTGLVFISNVSSNC
jgi:hypothetical protein